MMKARSRELAAHVAVLLYLAGVVFSLVDPSGAEALLDKEGPLEHLSHALLLVAAGLFSVTAIRARRVGPALVAVFLIIVLLEELDWGQVYEIHAVARGIERSTGDVNFHNRWSGHSYVLFALPVLIFGLLGLAPPAVRAKARLAAATPTRHESLALVILLITLALTQALIPGLPDPLIDELSETAVYTWFVVVGIRGVITASAEARS